MLIDDNLQVSLTVYIKWSFQSFISHLPSVLAVNKKLKWKEKVYQEPIRLDVELMWPGAGHALDMLGYLHYPCPSPLVCCIWPSRCGLWITPIKLLVVVAVLWAWLGRSRSLPTSLPITLLTSVNYKVSVMWEQGWCGMSPWQQWHQVVAGVAFARVKVELAVISNPRVGTLPIV